ncbi:MAG: hypothetical protein VX589_15860 [Myxococcota bacterium]|nr:hypothetical protein [Myxococcota bacterium]
MRPPPRERLYMCLLSMVLAMGMGTNHTALAGPIKVKAPFPAVEYAFVKAYLFNVDRDQGGGRPDEHIVRDGVWSMSKVGDGVRLNRRTVDTLNQILSSDVRLLTSGLSKCFIPRHGLVYFDTAHQPVASVSICFECEALRRWPRPRLKPHMGEPSQQALHAAEQQLAQLRSLLDGSLPVYDRIDGYDAFLHQAQDFTSVGIERIVISDWAQRLLGERPSLVTATEMLRGTGASRDYALGTRVTVRAGHGWSLSFDPQNKLLLALRVESSKVVWPTGLRPGVSWADVQWRLKDRLKAMTSPSQLTIVDDQGQQARLFFRRRTLHRIDILPAP